MSWISILFLLLFLLAVITKLAVSFGLINVLLLEMGAWFHFTSKLKFSHLNPVISKHC